VIVALFTIPLSVSSVISPSLFIVVIVPTFLIAPSLSLPSIVPELVLVIVPIVPVEPV